MALLAGRDWVGPPVESAHQRFVIREDDKIAALQHVAKMADSQHHRQKLPVKGAVIDLSFVQLSGEESQRPPCLPWPTLLDGGANVGSRGVCDQGNLRARSGVDQHRRRRKGEPGCIEGIRHRRRPDQWRGTLGAATKSPCQGLDYPCRRRNESPIKVEEAQERLQMLDCGWLWEIGDGLDPGGKRADAASGEAVAQEIHLGAAEQALVGVNNEPIALQNGENRLQVSLMRDRIRAGNENVVQVDEGEGQAAQHRVHQPLEGHAGVP
jgi:hypothetical protein